MPKIIQAEIATSFIYAVSPSAKVENLPNGNVLITITDKEGTTAAQVPIINEESLENIINEYLQEHPAAQSYIQQHNESASAHQDIRQLIQQAINRIPTRTSQLENNNGFITLSDIPVGPEASVTIPLMDGTASAGSDFTFARGDHRHPSDTNKVSTSRTIAGHALTSDIVLDKNDIGLNNVDNTADINKPISIATQAALDNKVNIETGKGLSTNDYDNIQKQKVNKNVIDLNNIKNADFAEAGKVLKAKEVEEGEVISWEFDDINTTDKTLSIEGKSADAKTVGNVIQTISKELGKVIVFDYNADGNILITGDIQNRNILFSDDGEGNITITGSLPDISFSEMENGNINMILDKKSHIQIKTDTTLTQQGVAADAKTVGDAFANMENLSDTGTIILSNTDLDSLTTFGKYYCEDNVTIQSLSNCPTESGFTLIVERNAATYIRQTIYDNHGIIYIRVLNPNNIQQSYDWKAVQVTL